MAKLELQDTRNIGIMVPQQLYLSRQLIFVIQHTDDDNNRGTH